MHLLQIEEKNHFFFILKVQSVKRHCVYLRLCLLRWIYSRAHKVLAILCFALLALLGKNCSTFYKIIVEKWYFFILLLYIC